MIIYIDESKKINKWKKWQYIFWWIITTYKSGTINKIYCEFLDFSWIKYKWELKSTDRLYKSEIEWFYNFLDSKWYMENIEFCWIYIEEYKENWNNYIEMLSILTKFIIEKNKFNNNSISKIQIIADNLKLDIKEKDIEKILNNKILKELKDNRIKKLWFTFFNSKKYWWLSFADFTSGILRRKYINNNDELPYNFIEYFVNKEIKIIKILNK